MTRVRAMSSNPVVLKMANLKIDLFHCINSQKSGGSIAPFSKIEWFHGTTGTTTLERFAVELQWNYSDMTVI